MLCAKWSVIIPDLLPASVALICLDIAEWERQGIRGGGLGWGTKSEELMWKKSLKDVTFAGNQVLTTTHQGLLHEDYNLRGHAMLVLVCRCLLRRVCWLYLQFRVSVWTVFDQWCVYWDQWILDRGPSSFAKSSDQETFLAGQFKSWINLFVVLISPHICWNWCI